MNKHLEKFLIDRGYKEFPPIKHISYASRAFQRVYREEGGKRFVNVWYYESEIPHHEKVFKSFEIDCVFETQGGHWYDVKAYSINVDELESQLETIEKQLGQVFTLLGGSLKD